MGAAAANAADPLLATAIAVKWSNTSQGCGGLRRELTEFRHLGEDRGGNHPTDTRYGLQTLGLVSQDRVGGDESGDLSVALRDELFEQTQESLGLTYAKRIDIMLGAVALHDKGVDQLAAALRQIGQALLLGHRGKRGSGPHRGPVVGQHGGIDRIGLGPASLGLGEVADTPRLHHAEGHPGGMESPHDGLLIAAGGLANDLCAWMWLE